MNVDFSVNSSHQFNPPSFKRSSEIIIELIVTANQIAVFYNSNCY